MKTFCLTSLTEIQTQQIQALQQCCMAFDCSGRELFLSNDMNYYKDMPCFFLSYFEETLCGVLIVFAPTMGTAEISAYVHPDHRRTGVFSGLLLESWQVLQRYNIAKVLIVTDAVPTVCREILGKWQAELSHSEYLLAYQGDVHKPDFPFASKCILREADESDIEKMVELNMISFGEDWENASHMVRENLKHPLTRCYIGEIEANIFGLANVRKEGSDFYICGFNIAPAYRKKGLGRYLLCQLLDRLTPSENESITLEVDSTNQPAYQLYTSSGFVVQSQVDYYRLMLPII
jgi:ribosomal protein S18 acetylase RimI-like enzyme